MCWILPFTTILGDIQGAASTIDEGRELDLADRYINTKTTKYMMRANKMDQVSSVKFLKSALVAQGKESTMRFIWRSFWCRVMGLSTIVTLFMRQFEDMCHNNMH